MNLLIYGGVAVLTILLYVLLRDIHSPLAAYLPTAAAVLILYRAGDELLPFLLSPSKSIGGSEMPKYYNTVLACFGIGCLTALLSDFAQDVADGSVSKKIELGGKCAVLILLLPLIRELLSAAVGVLSAF